MSVAAVDISNHMSMAPGATISSESPYGRGLDVVQQPMYMNPYSGVHHERPNLTFAFDGRTSILNDMVNAELVEFRPWELTLALQLVRTPMMHWAISQWKHIPTLPGRTAHEGPTRGIRSFVEEQRFRTTRHGIKFSIESDFFRTDAGKADFRAKMAAIVQSVSRRQRIDVIHALLSAPARGRLLWEMRGVSPEYMSTLIEESIATFAVLNKDTKNFASIVADRKAIMEQQIGPGMGARYLAVPPRVAPMLGGFHDPRVLKYQAFASDERPHQLKGPVSAQTYLGLAVLAATEPLAEQQLDQRNVDPTASMLHRNVMIGAYWEMGISTSQLCGPHSAQYNTCWNNIKIYDEEADKYVEINFIDAVRNSRLWDSNGNLRPDFFGADNLGEADDGTSRMLNARRGAGNDNEFHSNRSKRTNRHFLIVSGATNGAKNAPFMAAQCFGQLDDRTFTDTDLYQYGRVIADRMGGQAWAATIARYLDKPDEPENSEIRRSGERAIDILVSKLNAVGAGRKISRETVLAMLINRGDERVVFPMAGEAEGEAPAAARGLESQLSQAIMFQAPMEWNASGGGARVRAAVHVAGPNRAQFTTFTGVQISAPLDVVAPTAESYPRDLVVRRFLGNTSTRMLTSIVEAVHAATDIAAAKKADLLVGLRAMGSYSAHVKNVDVGQELRRVVVRTFIGAGGDPAYVDVPPPLNAKTMALLEAFATRKGNAIARALGALDCDLARVEEIVAADTAGHAAYIASLGLPASFTAIASPAAGREQDATAYATAIDEIAARLAKHHVGVGARVHVTAAGVSGVDDSAINGAGDTIAAALPRDDMDVDLDAGPSRRAPSGLRVPGHVSTVRYVPTARRMTAELMRNAFDASAPGAPRFVPLHPSDPARPITDVREAVRLGLPGVGAQPAMSANSAGFSGAERLSRFFDAPADDRLYAFVDSGRGLGARRAMAGMRTGGSSYVGPARAHIMSAEEISRSSEQFVSASKAPAAGKVPIDEIRKTDVLMARLAAVDNFENVGIRLGALALMWLPTNGFAVINWLQADLPLPIKGLLQRPFEEHTMGSVIMFRGGTSMGFTAFGHANATFSENTEIKTIHVVFTFYSKAILVNRHYVQIIPNVVAVKRLGGNNTQWLQNAKEVLEGQLHRGSLIFTLHGQREPEFAPHMSLFGTWAATQATANPELDAHDVHFSSARFQEYVWSFASIDAMRRRRSGHNSMSGNGGGINHVISREYCQKYDPTTGRFSEIVGSLSHRGTSGSSIGAAAAWNGRIVAFPGAVDWKIETRHAITG